MAPRLYDIPAHEPFLDRLAAGVLALAARADEPASALARATILLPTRRSARALREAFVRRLAPEEAMLLPRMRALAGLSTEDADELALPALLDLPPAVDPLRRQAVLTGFVLRLPPRHGGPASPEQAWQLAADLATLLDEIALEGCDIQRLGALVPEVHARHWEVTLRFLHPVAEAWEQWLAGRELMDVGARRVAALRAQARAWTDSPPAHPVIAAGIGIGTTIPAAAELLRAVARLERGAVVLHGLGEAQGGAAGGAAGETLWRAVGEAPSHPFWGQARLLDALGAGRGDVRPWPGGADPPPAGPASADARAPARAAGVPPAAAGEAAPAAVPAGRAALFDVVLRPAEGLDAWRVVEPARWDAALAGLSTLTAADAQAEAVAVALLLRGALERPGARAALVTPDRDLARRVSAELARHGVQADDSAGEPLAVTPSGAFLRLVARMVAEAFAPVPLLAVLKHPLCAAGRARGDWLEAVRVLEAALLRGPRPAPGLEGLRAAVRAALAPEAADGEAPDGGGARRRAEAAGAARVAQGVLADLAGCLGAFDALPGALRAPAALLAAHLAAAEALAATADEAGGLRLYAGEEGPPLAERLAALAPALAELPLLPAVSWPALLDAALDGAVARSVRAVRGRDGGAHPRVEILGLLEARLLAFDLVVLGALEETVWPLSTDPGPWLSRPMRAEFGLPPPEARIGRVCADFLLATCAAPRAVLSRAGRRGGAPTVPARWLVRLETFLAGQRDADGRGPALAPSPAAAWGGWLDRAADGIRPCPPPAPAPPPPARPRRLSVSDAGLLLADPYGFYARKVLRLGALSPLDAEAGSAEYGMLVHAALAGFVRGLDAHRGAWPGDGEAEALWEAEAARALRGARPSLAAFWGPRLARVGGFARDTERVARTARTIVRSHLEVAGELEIPLPGGAVALTARADRIDELADGTLAILDYKTGTVPGVRDVQDGAAPQLTLEAAIARAGGFAGVPAGPVRRLAYWHVGGGPNPGEETVLWEDPAVVAAEAEAALEGLRGLARDYLLGGRAFAVRPHPGRGGRHDDYAHLARTAEWAGAQDAAAEEGA